MDAKLFDDLARQLGSRRTAIGGLLAGMLLPLEAGARGKGNDKRKDKKRKHKSKDNKHTNAQAEPCWRAGACMPKKGANVSRCNLERYSPTAALDCTGCNMSRANLRGADLRGANVTKANLSGACLVDANFSGATFALNTNLANAIFCRTTMSDGSINNSGCQNGTACCATCPVGGCPVGQRCCANSCVSGVCCADAECRPTGNQCVSAGGGPTTCVCGLDAACSGVTPDCCPASARASGNQGMCTNVQTDSANCGSCGQACQSGQVCEGGQCRCIPTTCQALDKQCGSRPDGCGGTLQCGGCGTGGTPACNNGTCATCAATCPGGCHCANLADGTTRCYDFANGSCVAVCTSNADCAAGRVCVSSFTIRGSNSTTPVGAGCIPPSSNNLCYALAACRT